ncbi:MAG: hypothetical protein R2751_09890 [Bacteroidales bacterium]
MNLIFWLFFSYLRRMIQFDFIKARRIPVWFGAIALALFLSGMPVHAQEEEPSRTSIRTGLGLGINETYRELGNGFVTSIGWQRSLGERRKLRINPNLVVGGFMPLGITDTRDQFYRITSLGLNLHYDLLRYQAVSLVTTAGGFVNYSRGLLGTGGWPEANNNSSEYFLSFYAGANASFGLRIDPRRSRVAYEFRPMTMQFGNQGFLLAYLMVGVDVKL